MRPRPSPARAPGRRDVLRAALAAVTAMLAGCVPTLSARPGSTTVAPPASSPGAPSPSSVPSPASTAPAVTLRETIAGLLVVGFRGLTVETADPITAAIRDEHLGGVILFSRDGVTGRQRNIASPDQLRALTAGLQGLAGGRRLVVSIDQEGGRVARLTPATGFPAFESEAQVGASGDATVALDFGRRLGATLADVGVTLNLAPVVDVDVNPANPAIGALDRSFSADPAIVGDLALAEIMGHHEHGIATAIKHFPGLGSATVNTDTGVADASTTWSTMELEPFRTLVASGQLDAIMAGHVIVDRLGGRTPASLSPAIVTDLLRGELGWRGVVITDDLGAVAVTQAHGLEEALALAIEAGNDLLLLANQKPYDAHLARRAIDAIEAHVAAGRISRERLDASRARVAALLGR